MKDFIMAALPWVIMGISIAILVTNASKVKKAIKSNTTDKEETKKDDNYMSEGMCIGMSLGVVFGTTGIFDLGTGISLGMLVGLVIGMYIKK